MQISDEAVEAAARAWVVRGQKNPEELMTWFSRTPLMDDYRAYARAALEAALPHLLASQGCGTWSWHDDRGHGWIRAERDGKAYNAADDVSEEDGLLICEAVNRLVSAHPQKGGEG